jgi:hypothetical protein
MTTTPDNASDIGSSAMSASASASHFTAAPSRNTANSAAITRALMVAPSASKVVFR